MKAKPWTLLTLSFLTAMLVSTSQQRPLTAQSVSPPPPIMTIPIVDASITVHLENQATASITYEALGDTQPRVLIPGDEVTLQNLNIPTTLTFFYKDIQKDRRAGEGLLKATLNIDDTTGAIDILVEPTSRLGADVSNITIEPNGDVFVF